MGRERVAVRGLEKIMETENINGIPVRILGRTGVKVTVLCVGGYHIGLPRNAEDGIRIIKAAVDEGINFLDNSWCYHDGRSEAIMGNALQDGYRKKVFLMTKIDGRDSASYLKQLDESLARLKTDCIDLVQFHEIINDGEPQRIFAEGGIEAAVKARQQGKIRFIGFTGHKYTHLFREMLAHDFPWDTVQMPVNILDFHFRSFQKDILPVLIERGIGVIGMKSLAGSRILRAGITPEEAILYSLSMPIHSLVCGMEKMEDLKQDLGIARRWTQFSDKKIETLRAKAAPFASDGRLEYYKTREG